MLRDLAERNFEVAAQCVIDIAMRIGSMQQAPRSSDGATAIRRLGELGVLPPDEAAALAPLADFRDVLAHEYIDIDWDVVYGPVRGWTSSGGSPARSGAGSGTPTDARERRPPRQYTSRW